MNRADISELKNLNKPPEDVKIVMSALALMMGMNDTWDDAKKMLNDKNFLQCLIMYDKEHIHPQVLQVVKSRYTENPQTQNAFNVASIKKKSLVAASIA